ncbi:MAG: hypothetical protein IKV30_02775 [Clostridia bacterium]|nr:hypothetical protein [Clostridia bacterium]
MKRYYKLMALVLCVIILISFVGCTSTETTDNSEKTNEIVRQDIPDTELGISLKILRYNPFWCDVTSKTIDEGEYSNKIISMLNLLEHTGEVVDEISSEKLKDGYIDLPIETGTYWIEAGDNIFRISSKGKIYYVERHLGKGYELDYSKELIDLVYGGWFYYPYDYYKGSYDGDTKELILNHVFEAESTISISIKEISFDSKEENTNLITIEVISSLDQSRYVWAETYLSEDNRGSLERQMIDFKANEPVILKFSVYSFTGNRYGLEILSDNTVLDIIVNK